MLFLGDNFGLTLSLSKGRCASYPLLKILLRICAEVIASDIYPVYRWLPSELNCMDGLSRLWEGSRIRALKGSHVSGCAAAEEGAFTSS